MSRRRLDFFCLLEAVEAEGPEEGSEDPDEGSEDPDEGSEGPDEGSEGPEDPEGPEGLPEGFESSHLDAWSSLDIQVRVV